jgi:pilus assembly protein CpaB
MKQAQLVTLAIAGVAALGAAFMFTKLNSKPKKVEIADGTRIETNKVLVAKQEISLGQIVTADNFRWQEWPRAATNPAFIREGGGKVQMKDMVGRIARAPFLKDEPITEHKLIKAGEGGVLAAILPAGMRAISTKIREETSAGRLILPNDHVDVILIQRRRSKTGGEDFVSDTLFRNVRVLAIGQLIEAKEGKKNADGATATLELTPRQTELLALANSMGEISLALRSVADVKGDATASQNPFGQRGNSIRVLRYGVKSRAYGVN